MSAPAANDKKQGIVIYVAMAKKRLVIPIRDPSQKVFELGALIAARFRVERVAELRTSGFLLDGNDTIEEVLRDGGVIECLDYTGWMDENNQAITNNRGANWAEIECPDYCDDKVKWIRCGWAQNLGKFFIKMGGDRGWAPMQLDMFEPADLMSIAKKGKYVVSQIGDEKTGWFASAEFTAGENGAVDTVILRCKSKSDKREAIRSCKITVTPGTDKPVQCGEIKLLQSQDVPEETGVVYTLPPDEAKGPVYPEVEEVKVDPKAPKPEPPEIKGEGSLPLLITCKMKPEIDRGYQRNLGDRWDMNINLECEFLNRGEQSLILTKWTSEYKTKEGKWEALKLTRGQRQGFYNYRWENSANAKDSITIYGKTPQRYALGVSIPIDAPQLSRPRALHGSLPNPLEMKYTVTDVNGGSVSIVIPISSTPADMDLITLEKEKSNNGHGKNVLGYVQCDDTVAEGRIAATLYRKDKSDGDSEFELRGTLTNSYQTYSSTAWKRIGFQQSAKGVTEYKLENSCYESSGCTMESFALIDVPRQKVYAVKIALKTGTSSATKTILLNPPVAAATPAAAST